MRTRNLIILTFIVVIFSLKVSAQSETVTDIDGNVYKTIQIGNHTWMAENLKTTKLNNGKAIAKNSDPKTWKNMLGGGYCYYDNKQANATVYGALYNWHIARSKALCPIGWRVPSDADWDTLVVELGGTKRGFVKKEEVETLEIGAKLKDSSIWQNSDVQATNETNFNALPGGYCTSTGIFESGNTDGYWWSSTPSISYGAYCRYLKMSNASFYRNNQSKTYGMSVRCIKN